MADINLLQNSKQSPTGTLAVKNSGTLNRWLNYIGIAVLVLALAASVFFYIELQSLNKTVANQQSQVTALQSAITGAQNYPKLLKTQTKLADLKTLLDNHLDWSQLLPKFFNATLKGVTYSKFTANGAGQAVISGNVPSFVQLDKMIQGFQITPFDQYVKDVQLVNVGNISNQTASGAPAPGIQFTINVTFNQDILGLQVAPGTKVNTPALQNSSSSSVNSSTSTSTSTSASTNAAAGTTTGIINPAAQ